MNGLAAGRLRRFFAVTILVLAHDGAAGQRAVDRGPGIPADAARAKLRLQIDDARPVSMGRAFLIEAVGATAGSAAGLGLGLAITKPANCNNEDLSCTLTRLSGGLAASGAGALAGTLVIGHYTGIEPSTLGAVVGAVAGIPAGLGVVHLLSEDIDVTRADAVLFLSYVLTHGLVTALGSRVGRAISN